MKPELEIRVIGFMRSVAATCKGCPRRATSACDACVARTADTLMQEIGREPPPVVVVAPIRVGRWFGRGSIRLAILELLAGLPDGQGATTGAIALALRQSGVDVSRAINCLRAYGAVVATRHSRQGAPGCYAITQRGHVRLAEGESRRVVQ